MGFESEGLKDCGDMCEKYSEPSAKMSRDERIAARFVSHPRRLELQNFARKIAADVLEHTKPHERCLVRKMVEQLMPDVE